MKTIIRMIAGSFLLFSSLNLRAAEVDVYFLAGQSNMEGRGAVGELTSTQAAQVPGVFFWNGESFIPLAGGASRPNAEWFGPELSFGAEISKRERKAYIIKYANSGKPLDAGWNDQVWVGEAPGKNRVNFHPGTSASDENRGTLYRDFMLPRFRKALAAIRNAGDVPVIRGLVWMQGEQDAKNAASARRYAANLKLLRDRLAADLSISDPADFRLVYGQVLPKSPPEPRFTHRDEIRAEMALADQNSGSPKAIANSRMVSTDGMEVLPDHVHYNTQGQIRLGRAFAEAMTGAAPVGATLPVNAPQRENPQRPNIVIFLVDDMGWQDTSVPFHYDKQGKPVVSAYNQRYRTPNMQALADDGVKFTDAYSQSVCSPSRVSLMTGQNAARHRVTQWTLNPGRDQSKPTPTLKSPAGWNMNGLAPAATKAPLTWKTDDTLPRLLQRVGYRTIHVGKAHFAARTVKGEDPRDQGFDVNIAGHAPGGPSSFLGKKNFAGANPIWNVPGLEEYHGKDIYLTEALTLEANKEIQKSVESGKPFYLYMSHYAVHVPIQEDARFAAHYPDLDPRERAYATMIEGMDKSLGDIRAELRRLGVAKNTLIVFYSDNGGYSGSVRGPAADGSKVFNHNRPLRSGKSSVLEGGVRVPAMFGWAEADQDNPLQRKLPISAGGRCSEPILIEDLFPTLLGIGGASVPKAIDGVDIRGAITGQPHFHRGGPLLFHYPNINDDYIPAEGFTPYSALRDGNWKLIYFYEDESWHLYDLANDIGEAKNLASSRPDLVKKLGREMIRLLEERGAQFPLRRDNNQPKPVVLLVD